VYAACLAIGLALALTCTASKPFFGDLARSTDAIISGRMYIQFPGYVIFHLMAAALGHWFGIMQAFVIMSVIGALIAQFYIMRTAEFLGGAVGAAFAGAVAGCGLLNVYFAGVGSSYMLDMVAVAAVLYHGLRITSRRQAGSDLLWAALWTGVGIALRALSVMWVVPALVYLAWNWGSKRERWQAAAIVGAVVAAACAISLYYYGSVAEVINSTISVAVTAKAGMALSAVPPMLLRVFGFPCYFFQGWLLLGLAAPLLLRARANPFSIEERASGGLLVWMTIPYVLVLIRHIPNPGYICFLAPIVIATPFVYRRAFAHWQGAYAKMTVVFVAIALAQLYALHPVAPKSLATVVADAYYLQFSRAGMKTGAADTLSSLALRSHVGNGLVPNERRALIERSGYPAGE
jgi:hypothetical protein